MKIPKPNLSRFVPGSFSPKAIVERFRGGNDDVGDLDDGVPDYLKPTFVQRYGQLLALVGAYAAFIAIVGGTVLYTALNEEEILEAEIARRPSISVDPLKPEIVRLDEEAEDEEEAEAMAENAEAAAPATADEETQEASQTAQSEQAPAAEPPAEEELALLTPHPDPALIEETPNGPLPRIGDDGRKPWRVYSRPSNALETRPRVAVVVTDLGLADDTTEQALELPDDVTLAFAPFARKLDERIVLARDSGHEVLITLPMEPRDFPRSDPGPYALLTTLDTPQNLERLSWVLSRTTGYIGVTNYQGSGFTSDKGALRPIMSAIAERGLVYLDTREDAASAAPRIAEIAGAPSASADIIADQELTRAAILQRLHAAELAAKSNGTAIILIRPYPMAMRQVKEWARDLGTRGVVLAPLSAVISERAGI